MIVSMLHVIILSGWILWLPDIKASVTMSSVGNPGSLGNMSCGSTVTFVCHIQDYKYSMTWSVDTEIVAECTLTDCKPAQYHDLGNIEFSNNTTSGTFNMTFNPVTLEDNKKVIKCEDGQDSATLPLNVIVLPQENTTTISESKYQNFINVTVETGCLFPSSSATVTWYYFQTYDKVMLYQNSVPVEYTDESVCKTGGCGGDGVAKMLSTLSIPDIEEGNEYHFRVEIKTNIVSDNDYVVTVDSTRAYKLKSTTSDNGGLTTGAIAGITVTAVVIVVTVIYSA